LNYRSRYHRTRPSWSDDGWKHGRPAALDALDRDGTPHRRWLIVDPPDGKIPPLAPIDGRRNPPGEVRVIPLDGRSHVGKSIRLDMGDARGHWEGNTLVVETTNFNQRSTYRNANAATLRLVERFTRTAPDRIEWAVTIDDPMTWTKSWTFAMPLTMNEREPVLEFACHEGNYALRHILSAARAAERASEAAKKP
jgi:hypothetical protein